MTSTTDIRVGDTVALSRHGRTYNAEVVGVGPKNVRVRYTTLNGKTKTISEDKRLVEVVATGSYAQQLNQGTVQAAPVSGSRESQQNTVPQSTGPDTLVANATQEHAAAELFQTDWDENGTESIYLPTSVATALLSRCGYRFDERNQWVSPNGHKFWDTEDAARHAVTSIVMGGAR